MAALTNAIENNTALAALSAGAPRSVLSAIRKASLTTGVDFSYMVGKAAQESGFDPNAKARTSSATGLYQFIDKTWLRMVREHGDKYGLGEYADQIDDSGRVKNAAVRREILALRKDPETSALLAAEYAADNKRVLEQTWGGKVGGTELYLAHFLGAGGAAAFLKSMDENPMQSGADILPKAAASNRNVFYNTRTGRERSVSEIYEMFAQKFSDTQPFADQDQTNLVSGQSSLNQTIAVEGWDLPQTQDLSNSAETTALTPPDSMETPKTEENPWFSGLFFAPSRAEKTAAVSDRTGPIGPQSLLAPSEILLLARIEEKGRENGNDFSTRTDERRLASAYAKRSYNE